MTRFEENYFNNFKGGRDSSTPTNGVVSSRGKS